MQFFDSTLLLGLSYGIATLGLYISLRIFRFPDLTVDGSFGLGGAIFAAFVSNGCNPIIALLIAICFGALAGLATGALFVSGKIGKLLSGILVMTSLYSINFRILGKKPNLPINFYPSFTESIEKLDSEYFIPITNMHLGMIIFYILISAIIIYLIMKIYNSETGLVFRFTGYEIRRGESLSFSAKPKVIMGLMFSNGLVAFSGALITEEQGFADINAGTGLVIILLASLLIGEIFLERFIYKNGNLKAFGFALAPFLGTFIYYIMINILLQLSSDNFIPIFNIQPTDLKLLTALIVVIIIWIIPLTNNTFPKEERL
jgi:putative ABC transport system permease protein